MSEAQYQAKLIKRIKAYYPEAVVLKNDSSYIQGIPDLLVLLNGFWAALEVKVSPAASVQPNQAYYVEKMDAMSFAAFIFPENEEEVLRAMEHAYYAGR